MTIYLHIFDAVIELKWVVVPGAGVPRKNKANTSGIAEIVVLATRFSLNFFWVIGLRFSLLFI